MTISLCISLYIVVVYTKIDDRGCRLSSTYMSVRIVCVSAYCMCFNMYVIYVVIYMLYVL